MSEKEGVVEDSLKKRPKTASKDINSQE